jgi:hypothetical protein
MPRRPRDDELAVFYSQEIDALIRDLRRLGQEFPDINPFGDGIGPVMLEARHDRSLLPQLHQRLLARRAELEATVPAGDTRERHRARIPRQRPT